MCMTTRVQSRRATVGRGRALVSLLIVLVFGGCHVGPGPENYAIAHRATGVTTSITMSVSGVSGELLEVRDSGLVVLSAARVLLVPYRSIQRATFEQLDVSIGGGQPPSDEGRGILRTASRFPQGLNAELERRLLAALGQSELQVMSP